METLVRLLAPDAAAGAYNDWQLVFTTDIPTWAKISLLLAGLIALLLSWRGLQRLPPKKRALLFTLRALVGVMLAVLLLQPAVELRAVSKVRTRVALAVDSSRSMSLASQGGTRSERVAAHINQSRGVLTELSRRAVVEPALFGERLQPVESLPDSLPTDQDRTDLGQLLDELGWQSSGRELGALILYSDGVDTSGLTPEAARRKAAALGAPIIAVGFSDDDAAADLAVRRLIADDFAFVYNTVVIEAEIEARRLNVDTVLATLRRDGAVLQNQEVEIRDGRGVARFEFKPKVVGKHVYEVSVAVQEGESVPGNNSKSLVLKVIRDRIRILQVAGRPSWDVRFLRELLKKNPNVDLISFFILRSTTDVQKAAADELALIPFPVNELFTTELPSFDVVIYQNFSYRPYRMAGYLDNVRRHVSKGGKSFLMIGGDFGFEDGWYAGTEIADVLPVTLGGAMPWDLASYRPRLTREGRRHPITRLGPPGEEPQATLRRLPELVGVNPSLGLAPNSQALLTHPSLPGNPPVVAIREFESGGRSMAVTTDSMWLWRFAAVGDTGAGREFDRFWNQGIRWLIKDPELARVRVKTERSVVLKGDPVGAEVTVLGPDYRGLNGAKVRARLLDAKGTPVRQLEADSNNDGLALFRLEGVEPGSYKFEVRAKKGKERVGRAVEPIIVEAADIELQDPFVRPEILEALAEGSGGRFVDIDDALGAIELPEVRRVEVDRSRRVAIWNNLIVFCLLLLVAGLEWWLRRRAGLL